jgi:malonate-semialdehyde dehydrogenase (acetylating)/methylmalonate-semialdehyde dehydrogenase
VKAISFVGGDAAGKHIYTRAGGNGKRVQANMGAKSNATFSLPAYFFFVPVAEQTCQIMQS